MGNGVDRVGVTQDLAEGWLESLPSGDRAEAGRLLDELVLSWAQEADATPDPPAVLEFQRRDLEAAWADRDPAGRLQVLALEVLRRKVHSLGARTYALGIAILDGAVGEQEARRDGQELLQEAESLAPAVKALPAGHDTAPIRRELGEAMMEALFAVERKAMSARLDRERRDRASR